MRVKTGIQAGRGLGDLVADVTRATGLDRVAAEYSRLTGQPCGCAERQAFLNRLVPNV